MTIDFGRTADDYASYRAGFPDSFFERLQQIGIGVQGQRILDLATGTGAVARGLARTGAAVTALDRAPDLIAQARRIDRDAGLHVDYVLAVAESTPFAASSFDVVTAGQSWHWFDRPTVAAEVLRLLKPGGRLVIAHFDWLPLPGNVVEATERLIKQHNPGWMFDGRNGIHGRWATDVRTAGFRDVETFSYDLDVPYSHEAWIGRVRASAGVAASLPADAVDRFAQEHAALLAEHFPDDPLQAPHCVFAVVACAP